MDRKASVVAEFQDKYGETRQVQLTGRKRLTIARDATVTERMNQVIAPLIGQSIRKRRVDLGMTMEELAIRAGLRTSFPKDRIWEIENNTRGTGVKMGTLYALAYALACDPQELMPSIHDVAEAAGVAVRKIEIEAVSAA